MVLVYIASSYPTMSIIYFDEHIFDFVKWKITVPNLVSWSSMIYCNFKQSCMRDEFDIESVDLRFEFGWIDHHLTRYKFDYLTLSCI